MIPSLISRATDGSSDCASDGALGFRPPPIVAAPGIHSVPPQNYPHSLSGDTEDRGQLINRLAAPILSGHILDLRLSEPPKLSASRPLRFLLPRQLPGLIPLTALDKGF
jgi:hypothetical protein